MNPIGDIESSSWKTVNRVPQQCTNEAKAFVQANQIPKVVSVLPSASSVVPYYFRKTDLYLSGFLSLTNHILKTDGDEKSYLHCSQECEDRNTADCGYYPVVVPAADNFMEGRVIFIMMRAYEWKA